MADTVDYWHPTGTADDIYTQMKNKQYSLIQQGNIKLLADIGEGEFGQVHKGEWFTGNKVLQVAVKELKRSATEEDRAKLFKEAALMGQFAHNHVVMLHGVVNEGNKVCELKN
jgi:serine/threonine protein kinase